MRVDILQMQDSTARRRPRNFVDAIVDFTPAEAALIAARQLGDTPFFAGPATLSVIQRPPWVRILGGFTVAMGLFFTVFGEPIFRAGGHPQLLVIGLCTMLAGVAILSGYALYLRIRERPVTPTQPVTLGHVVAAGRVTLRAADQGEADALERELRAAFANVARLLNDAEARE